MSVCITTECTCDNLCGVGGAVVMTIVSENMAVACVEGLSQPVTMPLQLLAHGIIFYARPEAGSSTQQWSMLR